MKTVFKYPIPRTTPKFSVLLPRGFKFLCVQFQGEQLMLWAEVIKDKKSVQYDFQVFGTGHDIPEEADYLTTYFDGPFVFHLYRLRGDQ